MVTKRVEGVRPPLWLWHSDPSATGAEGATLDHRTSSGRKHRCMTAGAKRLREACGGRGNNWGGLKGTKGRTKIESKRSLALVWPCTGDYFHRTTPDTRSSRGAHTL